MGLGSSRGRSSARGGEGERGGQQVEKSEPGQLEAASRLTWPLVCLTAARRDMHGHTACPARLLCPPPPPPPLPSLPFPPCNAHRCAARRAPAPTRRPRSAAPPAGRQRRRAGQGRRVGARGVSGANRRRGYVCVHAHTHAHALARPGADPAAQAQLRHYCAHPARPPPAFANSSKSLIRLLSSTSAGVEGVRCSAVGRCQLRILWYCECGTREVGIDAHTSHCPQLSPPTHQSIR